MALAEGAGVRLRYRRNMDARLRHLERAAAAGDETARRRLCYERILLQPREPFRSPWKGGLWVGSDPPRIGGHDVALWEWQPPDRRLPPLAYLVWGTAGTVEVGPDYDQTVEIPPNPLYDRLRDVWLETEAECMEDIWRKPWPWEKRRGVERRFKLTETDTDGETSDAYWEKVYHFEHDLQDVLDLSWCLDPEWWEQFA
jgi:hypothetical protein